VAYRFARLYSVGSQLAKCLAEREQRTLEVTDVTISLIGECMAHIEEAPRLSKPFFLFKKSAGFEGYECV